MFTSDGNFKKEQVRKVLEHLFPISEFNKNLDTFIDMTVKGGEKISGQTPAQLAVIFFDNFDTKELNHDHIVFDSFDNEKHVVFKEIGEKYARDKKAVMAIFLISEVWIKGIPVEDVEKIDKPVSKYSDKEEAVVIAGLTLDHKTNISILQFKRLNNKRMFYSPRTLYCEEANNNSQQNQAPLLEEFMIGYLQTVVAERPFTFKDNKK